VEDDRGAVGDGEFVVAGGQAAPLFEQVDAAFDDVAAVVVARVEGGLRGVFGARPDRQVRGSPQ